MAYASYVLSAYSLTAVTLRLITDARRWHSRALENRHVRRYRTDLDFRLRLRLTVSFGVNLCYSVYKAALGLLLGSVWFGAMAAYYLVLSAARFLLLRGGMGSLLAGYKKRRFCGLLLAVMTVPIAVIGAVSVYTGGATEYPGHLIFAAAAYTFYSLTMAIVNICRFRGAGSPVYSAANALALMTALVSMFFLQGAMFLAFGDGSSMEWDMNLIFAAVLAAMAVGGSVYLVADSAIRIRALKDPDTV
jgi:heme/copper-type cytochrome/quinol oxidase subunit 4